MTIHDALLHLSRRDRLIAAASDTFARSGFQGATVAQIAARAGVSAGFLYRHFPSKTALARAIVEQDRERTRRDLEKLAAYVEDPRHALRLLIEGAAEAAASAPLDCRLLAEIAAEAGRDPEVAETVIDSDAANAALVTALLRRAGLGERADAFADLMWSTLDGLALRVSIVPEYDPRPAAAALIDLLNREIDAQTDAATAAATEGAS